MKCRLLDPAEYECASWEGDQVPNGLFEYTCSRKGDTWPRFPNRNIQAAYQLEIDGVRHIVAPVYGVVGPDVLWLLLKLARAETASV